MTDYKIPPVADVVDQQFVTVRGPDGIQTGFLYDAETRTFWNQPGSIIIPSFHGQTHVNEDPVPLATIDRMGLMDRNDKAKLDSLVQMRVGVLGFQGAGFGSDGGFIEGDLILAAGTEFISLERIGNIVRFSVESPIPLSCGQEACATIYWIQDESSPSDIRPPSCAGKLPGVNSYGELKAYLLPENMIIDPSNPLPSLNKKSSYPAFIFKRYENSTIPGYGEIHAILSRNSNLTTQIGWSMTPGATGKVENIWFMGLDDEGNQIKFQMDPNSDADMLGLLLYKGHSLTRRMAVVASYSSSILADNIYNCKFWNIDNEKVIGDEFTAKNIWQYNNPGNAKDAIVNAQAMVLDATVDLLPIGTLVQIWEFQVGESNGVRLVRRYFNKEPRINPYTLWSWSGGLKFGDLLIEREEVRPGAASEEYASETNISDIRLFERTIWGITVFEDRLILSDDGETTGGTEAEQTLRSDSVSKLEVANPDLPQPNTVIRALLASTCISGLSFIVNQFVGHALKFTSGLLADQSFLILQNSASSITLSGDATTAEPGDTFDIYVEGKTGEPSGVPINNYYVADIDPTLPGLVVKSTDPEAWTERPVYVWHRINHKNFYMKMHFGQPESSRFPPIDLLLRAPVDSFDDVYMKIIRRGVFESGPFRGMNYIVVKGMHWDEVPPSGALRTLTGIFRNETWHYYYKAAFSRWDDDCVTLIGLYEPFLFDEDFVPEVAHDTCGTGTGIDASGTDQPSPFITVPGNTTVAQLLHAEYNAACCRMEFSINDTSDAESIQLQYKVGILDMGTPYELGISDSPKEDLVRGMKPGEYAVSRIYTQQGFIRAGTETVESEPENFRCYYGGYLPSPIDGETEKWNVLEIMYRDDQIWIWHNGVLVPPSAEESAKLSVPIPINTPYFPVHSPTEIGKVALRLWPGTSIRKIEIRDQNAGPISEFMHGQLQIES